MALPVSENSAEGSGGPWVAHVSEPVRRATVAVTAMAAVMSSGVGVSELVAAGATEGAGLSMAMACIFALMAFMVSEH